MIFINVNDIWLAAESKCFEIYCVDFYGEKNPEYTCPFVLS